VVGEKVFDIWVDLCPKLDFHRKFSQKQGTHCTLFLGENFHVPFKFWKGTWKFDYVPDFGFHFWDHQSTDLGELYKFVVGVEVNGWGLTYTFCRFLKIFNRSGSEKSVKILKFLSKIFPRPKYFQKWPFSKKVFKVDLEHGKGFKNRSCCFWTFRTFKYGDIKANRAFYREVSKMVKLTTTIEKWGDKIKFLKIFSSYVEKSPLFNAPI